MNTLIVSQSFGSSAVLYSHTLPIVSDIKIGILSAASLICFSIYQNIVQAASRANPVPIIFKGMWGVAVVESIGITYEVFRRLLGKREFFASISPENIDLLHPLNKCRYRMWKIIFYAEKYVDSVDNIYSRIFQIRNEQEIKEQLIPERELDLMEIVRIAFKEQIEETIHKAYPTHGYTFLLITIALGTIDKVEQIFQRIQSEKIKERKESAKTSNLTSTQSSNLTNTHTSNLIEEDPPFLRLTFL